MKLSQGYIQVYTGNGKGKTTAAIGQAIRALGAGLRVCMIQFMKDYHYSELNILEKLSDQFSLYRYGNDRFVFKKEKPTAALLSEMQKGVQHAHKIIQSGVYDVVILDEICVSVYFQLIEENAVIELLKSKPGPVELILTGRYCSPSVLERADLITTMNEDRHYYQKGVLARKGIES